MISAQGLEQAGALDNQSVGQTQQFARQQAAAQAAQQFKNGDLQGAYATLAAHDPEWINSAVANNPQLQGALAQAKSQGTETGSLTAQSQLGSSSIPVQVANIGANARIQAAQTRQQNQQEAESTVKDGNGNIFFKDKKGNITGQLINGQKMSVNAVNGLSNPNSPNLNNAVADTGSDMNSSSSSSSQPQFPSYVAPAHQKIVNSAIDDLAKGPDFKDFNTEINGLKQAQDLASGNLPNSQVPLAMKFLTSSEFVKRFNEAEFTEGPTQAQAIVDKVKNAVANKTQGNLAPEVMDNFKDIMYTMYTSTLNQYEDQIHAKAGAITSKTNGAIKADQALQYLLPAANPQFQKEVQNYGKLPPQDQQAVDWARKNIGNPAALKILRANGF